MTEPSYNRPSGPLGRFDPARFAISRFSRILLLEEKVVDSVMTHHTDTWQDLAREASVDHLTANSICILACNELDQNGCSEGMAVASLEQ